MPYNLLMTGIIIVGCREMTKEDFDNNVYPMEEGSLGEAGESELDTYMEKSGQHDNEETSQLPSVSYYCKVCCMTGPLNCLDCLDLLGMSSVLK